MRRTAILRFSDAEASTIDAHLEIIHAHGSTWWGWWKKDAEAFPSLPFLTYLRNAARREPLRLGLLNRKGTERFAVATCVDVAFAEPLAPIPSPEVPLTPAYYRDQEFPAWFRFTRIDDVSRTAFRRDFGGIPALDPTLYDVFEDDGKPTMRPGHNWTMEPIAIHGDTILHISDLHFGADHGFPLEGDDDLGVRRRTLAELLAERLRDLGKEIGIVVVSGDLITRGDANAYPAANAFLSRLLELLELERDHCVIVPGNHDLWVRDEEHPTRRYAHEEPYKDFVSGFFQAEFQGLERVRRYRRSTGDDFVFIELNSCRIRSDALKEYGFVAKHRYEPLLDWVNDVLRVHRPPSGRAILFAVLHHHVLPVWAVSIPDEERPVSLCLDAGELIDEFQRHGVRFVLHGHQHFPFIGMASRAPTGIDVGWRPEAESVFVLGCGSSGARGDRLPRDVDRGVSGNIYGLYTIGATAMQVTFEQYTNLQAPATLWRMVLPL